MRAKAARTHIPRDPCLGESRLNPPDAEQTHLHISAGRKLPVDGELLLRPTAVPVVSSMRENTHLSRSPSLRGGVISCGCVSGDSVS